MVQAADLQKSGLLQKDGIRLVSVTTDQPADLAAAAEQYGITTPLLSDPTTSMSKAYGMLSHGGMQMPGEDGHAFMLLDPSGKVLWHQAYQSMYVAPDQLMADLSAPGERNGGDVMSLVLLTATDCHLCEHAKDVLAELGSDWREVHADSEEGQRLAVGAPPFRPVLYDSQGKLVAYGRLSLKRLRKQLHREEVRT